VTRSDTLKSTSGDCATSPFFNRSYGGFTHGQRQFFAHLCPPGTKARILDPMAGQAFSLADWAHRGSEVGVADINPGPLALAVLRDPRIVGEWKGLLSRLLTLLRSDVGSPIATEGPLVVDTWLSPHVERQVREYGDRIGIRDEKSLRRALEREDPFPRFALAILVLAARRISCFRGSDNLTWLKPGGLVRETDIRASIVAEIPHWRSWAGRLVIKPKGRRPMRFHWNDARAVADWYRDRADVVVTSPPYANRLDYTRMWGPELAVLAAVAGVSISEIQRVQIGSNVVEGLALRGDGSGTPPSVRRALRAIRTDPSPYSDTYYFPFFEHYAMGLGDAMRAIARVTRRGGIVVVFVRDTVRKDVLFPTGDLVTSVLTRGEGYRLINSHEKVVRSHVGFRRKRGASSGLYGLAQRESWLAFKRVQ